MGKPQKYRGVRQRHWGSWVSEIRHPLLKTRIWLGTFETAKDAARAYDEAARIMCGSRAKTNFPYDPTVSQSESSSVLSATLMAKLQGFSVPSLNKMMMDYYGHNNTDINHHCKGFSGHGTSQLSTSLTCLRLDTERSNLGIWQQKGGSDDAQSNWVMTVKLPASIKPETEEDIASEMIQELLLPSCDVQFSPDDGNSLSGDVAEQMRH